ncbi:MAG TPA: hypothetical protein VFF50_03905 [Candidatus Deferrimicrobiaceae bacterium]|jgi:hypothetical protein|nr:hypothetical protein [Candidatus Deferrimicrobiaceae bacterium]
MKSDPSEYKDVIRKLLEKTRQRKVEWEQVFSSSFRCTLPPTIPSGDSDSFHFTISYSAGSNFESEAFTLRMLDQGENVIFEAEANDLPTSSEEEEVSQMLKEIYERARRQALKIERKIELASTLLDRV